MSQQEHDPYANQYPPPRVLREESQGSMMQQPRAEPFYLTAPEPPHMEDEHSWPPATTEQPVSSGQYHDPHAMTLEEYNAVERLHRLREQNTMPPQNSPPPPASVITSPDLRHHTNQAVVEPTIRRHESLPPPIQQRPSIDSPRPVSQRPSFAFSPPVPLSPQSQARPQTYFAPPPPPVQPTFSPHGGPPQPSYPMYGPAPPRYGRFGRYGPASVCCSCCSCFCMLFSLFFLAAGIALIVASSILDNKCSTDCQTSSRKGVVDTNGLWCETMCSQPVHDGFLYGGIGITALAGLSVLWRLGNWLCTRH